LEKKDLPPEEKDAFDDEEFCDALTLYRSMPIGEAIAHRNPLVRMFAVLDRRIGKRTLLSLAETLCEQPAWLQPYYRLRLQAEGIPCPETPAAAKAE